MFLNKENRTVLLNEQHCLLVKIIFPTNIFPLLTVAKALPVKWRLSNREFLDLNLEISTVQTSSG